MNIPFTLPAPLVVLLAYLQSLRVYFSDRGDRWYMDKAPCDKGMHTEYGMYRNPRSNVVYADSNFRFTTVEHQQFIAAHIKSLGYKFDGVGPLLKLRWWHTW